MTEATETLLGRGLIIPFRREGGDFASGKGSVLLRSMIRQVLMTSKGRLRWDLDFGCNLERYRHKGITTVMVSEIQADVVDSLLRYVPNIEVTNVTVSQDRETGNKLIVRVSWRAILRERNRNIVLTDVDSTEVKI